MSAIKYKNGDSWERIDCVVINNTNVVQQSGTSVTDVMSQSAVTNALNGKTDSSDFTTHTASTVHMTTTEKTNLDSLATNIDAISGITSAKVTSWDNAVNDLSALTADVSGQSETVAAALNELNNRIYQLEEQLRNLNNN